MSILDYLDSSIFIPVYKNDLPEIVTPSLDKICKELFYAIKSKEQIFVYGDYDMDGFSAVKVWQETLASLYDVPPIVFRYSKRMHNLDPDIIRQVRETKCRLCIICDTGSSLEDREIISKLRVEHRVPIIIDHHDWSDGDYEKAQMNMFVFNSHEESQSLGGCEISGAYASCLVAKRLCEKYFSQSLPYTAMLFALASMYSDMVDLATPVGKALYNAVRLIKAPGSPLLDEINTWGYQYSRRYFSFICAPLFNACFRAEEFGPLNEALRVRDKYRLKSIVQEMRAVHSNSSRMVDILLPMFSRESYGGITLCLADVTDETRLLHMRNFSRLIANRVASETHGIAVVLIRDVGLYEGSYSDFYDRPLLNEFKLFCHAAGHSTAFGIKCGDIANFRRHLKMLSGSLDVQTDKNYVTLSSTLVKSSEDVEVLALYNEYMNCRQKIFLLHRCGYLRMLNSTRWSKNYDIGLHYTVKSKSSLTEGLNILLEPAITKDVEFRIVD